MSRSSKIKILLAIDVVFFFVEIISGYTVGSLALVADSFHMLNDVLSLIVALYAIQLTAQSTTDSRYSYGWHRAEILAALANGVFLLALCFSITLEALERFFSTPEISNPRLIVLVGSLGLASNLVGLFLFREESHSHSHTHATMTEAANDMPQGAGQNAVDEDSSTRPVLNRTASNASDDYALSHPLITGAAIVRVAHDKTLVRSHSSSGTSTLHSHDGDNENLGVNGATEETPLLAQTPAHAPSDARGSHHGHSHSGSMNMRALVLHVLGDALGNVGVIATGLVIWKSSWSFKYYFDPVISLVIAVIIFSSVIPLVRRASLVLLQGVPSTVSLDRVRDSIRGVKGVLGVHELHIWQLSESKNIASVHILVSRDLEFMPIAAKIRKLLHDHGIHSCTIQPEYTQFETLEHVPMETTDTSCLVVCPPGPECNSQDNACCPPPSAEV
ncbi:cation efflux protein [Mycena epipterygia]|nr:cation efflux protein [Mycena epipterygia]